VVWPTLHALAAEFAEYDADRSGSIDYREYVVHTLREALAASSSRVVDLLRRWGGGASAVGAAEFGAGLRALGFDVDDADADGLFAMLDTDGSGEIEFAEMNRLLRQRARTE
jgi:hypothetical protein